MGLYLKNESERSQLQKRIAADLADKAKKNPPKTTAEQPDGVDDSNYVENTKQTTSLAWVWIVIFIAVVAIGVYLATR